MPRAFISSGVSVLAAPLGAGWPPGAPENSLTPTNTSSSVIGISSHLSSGLLFIARSSGRAGRGGRRQVRGGIDRAQRRQQRSEEHTSELQSLMRISYAVFCLKKKQETSK